MPMNSVHKSQNKSNHLIDFYQLFYFSLKKTFPIIKYFLCKRLALKYSAITSFPNRFSLHIKVAYCFKLQYLGLLNNLSKDCFVSQMCICIWEHIPFNPAVFLSFDSAIHKTCSHWSWLQGYWALVPCGFSLYLAKYSLICEI